MDINLSDIERETYFMIARFLEDGPCQEAAKAIKREIEINQLLPKRTDWTGELHHRSLEEMKDLNMHVSPQYLITLLSRLRVLVDIAFPTKMHNLKSLLTTGSASLLRESSVFRKPRSSTTELACYHGRPGLPAYPTQSSNIVQAISGRSLSGTSGTRNLVTGCDLFSNISMHKRILGHLASVYCVLFDRTGHVIATGADDNLVKLWSSFDGRLLATLRGHSGEISDLAINRENTLIAAGSCDKTIRVWNLTTTAPVAVLQGHTGMITSLEFCPSAHEDARYLMSTGGDGTVCFWKWDIATNKFETTPVKFNEKSRPGAQMLCSSFSPGGGFLVAGSSDNIIRVYQLMPAPIEKIAELTAHCDHVDSIQFSHDGFRFATGSRDGTARIWQFQRNEWRHIALNAYERLKSSPSSLDEESLKSLKLKVTMVDWNVNDQFLVTAITDHSLKVWDTFNGELLHILIGHSDEVFVLECHPHEPHIYLSAGHDGNIIVWDIWKGVMLKSFFNLLEGQGHGAIFDSRFAPDGMGFAVSDSHGHLCIFGFGSDERYNRVPYEQFFHTDYRPLIRDANNFILDEQTQMAPHLMPPPFLVDVDGNPHPQMYQLLIPGRNANNLPTRRVEIPVADLPPLLAEIAAEEAAASGRQNLVSPERRRRNSLSPLRSPSGGGGGGGGVGLRQIGDVEGVRQVDSNVFISQDVSEAEQAQWRNRTIIPMSKECFRMADELYRKEQGKEEIERYTREKKKRALSSSSRLSKIINQEVDGKNVKKRAKGGRGRAAPRQRITYTVPSEMLQSNYGEEDEEDYETVDVEQFISSEGDSDWNSDSSDSSDDSDWTAEVGLKKEQRESRRRRTRVVFSSEDDNVDDEEGTENESEVDVVTSEKDGDVKMGEKEDVTEKEGKKQASKSKKKKQKKKEEKTPPLENEEEYWEYYRVPEWMRSISPQKSPYVPQIGDEIYYFRQGHELYVKAVLEGQVFEINPKKQCYMKYDLKSEELCRVITVNYTVGPPRTCSLRLALISMETGANTGGTISVRYHDMPNVVDFFVLKEHYEEAKARNWKPGDRFRCAIEERWWIGTIIRKSHFQEEFPASLFHSLEVRWDTGEKERMSPWDMEPIPDDGQLLPTDDGDVSFPVTDEERNLFDNQSLVTDWPDEGKEQAIDRISQGIELFSELPVAGAFAYPVDVESYPDYLSTVAYPTDLNTIRQRLVNKFYRRRSSLLWEVRLIELNTKGYNEENSEISKNSSIVTKFLVSFICDPNCRDPLALFNEKLESGGFESESKSEREVDGNRRASKKSKTSKKKSRSKGKMRNESSNESTGGTSSSAGQSWMSVASDLIDFLMSREDSEPFRIPVDTDRYPDYTTIVQEPMDFSTIRQRLDSRCYDDAEAVIRDVRLVFSNSRLYNTNKRSRIYGMTLRLSALFEDRVQALLSFSDTRKTRKQKLKDADLPSSVAGSRYEEKNRKYSISNDAATSRSAQDNPLRLVLRRNSDYPESLTRSTNVDGPGLSCGMDLSLRSTRTLSRRTGIAINLHTGRARELSDDVNPSMDNKTTAVQSMSSANEEPSERKQRKKVKRVTMPSEFLYLRARRSDLQAESDSVDSVATRSRDDQSNDSVGNQKKIGYSTRSGRKVRPKRFATETDSEKENKEHEENGAENYVKRRKQNSSSTADERTDNEYEDSEELAQDGEGNISEYGQEDGDGERSSNEDGEDTDGFSDDYDISETVEKNVRRRTSDKRNSRSKKAKIAKSTVDNSRKRRRSSTSNDIRSRKSRRTRLKVNYNEDIEDDTSSSENIVDSEDDSNHIIGVSSRGRLRKAALRYADFVES